MKRILRLGTRGSKLALRQAEMVRGMLTSIHPGLVVETVPIKTRGDEIRDQALAPFGGKGLFVKEIEEALLKGQIDLAVHSMKDLPSELPDGLIIGAVPLREDPRDVFISRTGLREVGAIHELPLLPQGAKVGTSSLRRRAQLLFLRPDLIVLPLRGNLDTRLRKLREGQFEGIVVASAGLKRMGWEDSATQYLPVEEFVPAIGQGALGVEIRAADEETAKLISPLNHEDSYLTVMAERAFSRRLGGGCQVPVAATGQIADETMTLIGLIISLDGRRMAKGTITGPPKDATSLGKELAEKLLKEGGEEIIESFART